MRSEISRPEALAVIMSMMKKAHVLPREVQALEMAARAILKKHLDSSKNYAARRARMLAEKVNVASGSLADKEEKKMANKTIAQIVAEIRERNMRFVEPFTLQGQIDHLSTLADQIESANKIVESENALLKSALKKASLNAGYIKTMLESAPEYTIREAIEDIEEIEAKTHAATEGGSK